MTVSSRTANFRIDLDAKTKAAIETVTDGIAAADVQKAMADKEIKWKDGGTTLLIGHDWRTLQSTYNQFRKDYLKLFTVEDAMAVATDRYKKIINDAIDDARDACRDSIDPSTYQEPPAPKVDPADSASKTTESILSNSPGMAVGRTHKDTKSCDMVGDILDNDSTSVELLFIEEFDVALQAEIDAYLTGGDGAKMGDALADRIAKLKENKGVDWAVVLDKAKAKGVKVYGIDTADCEPGVAPNTDPLYGERRAAMMNAAAADVVKKAQAANPGKKFLLMCGDAHLNTHPGGVPGLSQMLGVPGMQVSDSGDLRYRPDDKSQRGLPSKAGMERVEAGIQAAAEAYSKIKDRDPERLDFSEIRQVMTAISLKMDSRSKYKDATAEEFLKHRDVKKAIAEICDATKGRAERTRKLKEAIKAKDAKDAKALVDEDPGIVKLKTESGETTLLHDALQGDDASVARVFLDAGADPNALDENGVSPMHLACRSRASEGDVSKLVKKMMAKGGDPNVQGPDCKTPYDLTVERSGTQVLEDMIDAGEGDLRDLFIRRFEEQARAAYDADRDKTQHEDFNKAELRRLAERRYDSINKATPLRDKKTVEERLGSKRSAKRVGELIELTKARKQRRADVLAAIDKDDDAAVTKILTDDPLFLTLENEQQTVLGRAAEKGSDKVVRAAIAAGADVNHVSSEGRTALHEVMNSPMDKKSQKKHRKQAATAKILLDAKADPNIQNRGGQTPLHVAGFQNNPEVIRELADSGRVDPDIEDRRGWTAYEMTLGSTNKEAEAAFLEKDLADEHPPIESGKHSTVDILCMVTKCMDPNDAKTTREMYEKLYSIEMMRPILDLAAAAACNDRNPPKGGLRIFAANSFNVGQLFSDSIGPTGAYDEKVNSLLIGTRPESGKPGIPEGTLAHELTHMAAHLVSDDERTLPYKRRSQKKSYIEAIEVDMKLLQRLNGGDPSEAYVQERISGRMNDYNKKRPGEDDFGDADERLLQEHIVSIPQLMAKFGPEYVAEHAPNLTKFFQEFSAQAKRTLERDDRFKKGRAKISSTKNKRLVQDLDARNVAPQRPKPARQRVVEHPLDIDDLVSRIYDEHRAQAGHRKDVSDGGGPSIASSADDFELDAAKEATFRKREKMLRKALATMLASKRLPNTIYVNSLTELVTAIGEKLDDNLSDKELKAATIGMADVWVKERHIESVNDRVEGGLDVSAEAMATAAVYQAELRARAGKDDFELDEAAHEVKSGKQKDAIKALAREFGKDENKDLLNKPPKTLLESLTAAASKPGAPAFRIKTTPKRVGKRNPDHVSIDVVNAKREWVAALGTFH